MLIDLNSKTIQRIADAITDGLDANLKQRLVDQLLESASPVVNYNDLSPSTSIDAYLHNTDEFCDTVSALYQELVTRLQQTAEADASPRAYWDLAEKLLLRTVADAISSTQDDMRSENNDSTFKSEPRQ
jgi:hypothetical protein